MADRKRCCCNCGNDIRTKDDKGNVENHCSIDGHRIGYIECFEGWCRRWKKDHSRMKAWLVREKDEYCATVVFAETRGKARSLATHTEICEDVAFCDIDVHRRPNLDKYYVDGKKEMDWFNSEDRIALVKDGGFCCEPSYWEPEDCENCPAGEFCDSHQDRLKEREEQSWM